MIKISEELNNKDQFGYYEQNKSNYNTETLFTEMYRTMVKYMGEMAKNENSSVDSKLYGKYLWILTNLSWATIRVAVNKSVIEMKELDDEFKKDILNLETARVRIFKLIELGAEAGLMIRQDYGVTDYDNMFTKQGII